MTIDITKEPYNDRFDPSKQYEQVLFNPDVPLQASELTELQSILKHQSSKLGNVLMVDGDIQDGMGYTISGNNETITIAEGDVYLGGQVRTFNEQSIPFNSLGTFKVCVALRKEAITADEDKSLMDTTSGVESYFSYGADRLKETVYLTSDETEGVPIFEFRNGDLHTENPGNREQTRLNEILAERTYDESGSYKVEGFRIYSEPHPTNQNMLNIVVDTGRAYVRGFQIDKPTPARVAVEKAQERNTIDSEVFWYNSSTKRGKLGSSPVARVNRVTGQVQVTREAVNRGATGDSADTLGNTSVASVVKVWSETGGSESVVYKQGTDFQLRNGNQIDWSPAGAEPGAGTTYYVTYLCSKTLVRDSDYRVITEGELDNFATYIDFNGLTGSKPVADTMVLVDYDYYLAREDLILLDKDGEVHVQPGQPGSLESVRMPNSIDPYMLALGAIKIYPNSTTTEPKMSTNTRLSMTDLQNMKNRIANVEYNQAVHALDQPAMEEINPTVLRGVFTDGFINISKYDSSHTDAKIGFSFEDAQITLPHKTANKKRPTFLEGTSNAHTWGRLVTAPFTEEVAISQPHATETMNINPYEVFNNIGVLNIDPSEDNWIDEDNITIIEDTKDASITVTSWWGGNANKSTWVGDDLIRASDVQFDDGGAFTDGRGYFNSRSGEVLREGGTRTIESKIEFMRPTVVNFHAQNLRPNDNNLYINFDGKRAPITPASGFSAGTDAGSIRSNLSGEAKGKFTVPTGVRTGVREVSLENMNNFAATNYVAEGTKKTTETTIRRTRVTVRNVDPLAQSFQLREDRVVSSIDLFFATKDSSENVTVQVRGITPGGMPNKTIYAETVLKPEQVKTSSNGKTATKVIFEDPLLVDAGKEYALVLIANSDMYTMWTATRGERDVNSGNMVTSNPYLTGVLYSSSNSSAWTVHQDSDLKFNINVANFSKTADLEFSTMTDISADAMVLMATTLTPSNTGSTWDVKLVMSNESEEITVANKEWVPLSNYEELELDQIAREVKLRAKFTANRYMSPIMSLDDLLLASFLNELSGSYVGRTVDASGGAEYNHIKLSYESFEPGTSKIIPRYSTDGGKNWRTFKETPIAESRTGEFTKYTYEEKITNNLSGFDSFKVRLDFTTPNSFVRPKAQRLMCVFQYH